MYPPLNYIHNSDYATQYLNDTDPLKKNHTCRNCPLGGYCEGATVTWKEVKALYGWWRLAKNRTHPPTCLSNHLEMTEPPCAFEKCLNPQACLGAPNPGKFLDDLGQDLAAVEKIPLNIIEECNQTKGYANWCECNETEKKKWDNRTLKNDTTTCQVRCRLCGTCYTSKDIRWKRTGAGTKCKICPSHDTNRLLLGVGFFVMVVGSTIMIYMEITSETSKNETSDAVKKVLLNFLQMISLASGLPLEWPPALVSMFDGFNTVSSAGSNLMIPDCELTSFRTAEAFYYKQIGFTFLTPVVVMTCILAWSLIYCCCSKKCKLSYDKIKDYTILSITLMLFLSYSMLVRLCFSMFKCPYVDGKAYLMADLQEPCYEGEHIMYTWLLTVPQIVLYVFGLPTFAILLVLRNKDILYSKKFYTRYGLLYMGYREGREWWEGVIALRKISIVAIGTFGTLMGVGKLNIWIMVICW